MKIKELTVTAVIPTAQYANLQPSITVELNEGDDYEAAKKTAMEHISKFSTTYAESGKELPTGQPRQVKARKMTPFLGDGEIFFDAAEHVYMDAEGNVFQSGSQFAKQFEQPFNADAIAPKYAAKFGLQAKDVLDFWQSKADASTTFGTALHQALETEGKYLEMCKTLTTDDKEVTTGINPTFQPIVAAFYTPERLKEKAVYEPFVVDFGAKRCGQIDRFLIVDEAKKICDIEDYKTNGDLYKQNSPKFLKAPYDTLLNQPISGYQIQLNFYRAIVEANGWTVRNLTIHHWTGKEWITSQLDKLEI